MLREALEKAGRDPAEFPISKRVFLSVHERPEAARAELHRWFTVVYRNPEGTDASGIHGTPEQVRERLEELVAMPAPITCCSIRSPATRSSWKLAEVAGYRRALECTSRRHPFVAPAKAGVQVPSKGSLRACRGSATT